MKPETLRDVIRALPCDGATTLAFLGALPVALLEATVYRSDADAPTAIVSAALREKAIVEAETVYDRNGLMVIGDEVVDAVLSTVLGRPVRYAKEILYDAYTNTDGNACATVEYFEDAAKTKYRIGGNLGPDDIAILEEARKEGDK